MLQLRRINLFKTQTRFLMKKFVVALFLLLFSTSLIYGQKTRYGQAPRAKQGVDYPLKVHISGIHIRTYYKSPSWVGPDYLAEERNEDVAYADAVLDGKKIELLGAWTWIPGSYQTPLSSGDFQARLLKDSPKMSVGPIGQEYELILPERIVWRCTVTGVSE
jgi:hypothetical protein